jgi:cobalt-precorrin-5B (C1)-methyltransferase
VGDLLDYAVYKGFKTLLLIGHSGKLVKLAQGSHEHSFQICRLPYGIYGAVSYFSRSCPAGGKKFISV